jgi:hypothetical protein
MYFRQGMKNISITKYLSLNETKQYELLLESGVLVGVKQEYPLKKYLYAIEAFFVEITFCEKSNRKLYKKVFKEGELLESYLTFNPNILFNENN